MKQVQFDCAATYPIFQYNHSNTIMTPTLRLAIDLINKRSVTPEDCGCQSMLVERLDKYGFASEHLRFDDVDNLWSITPGEGPIFCFAGHTDVVPTGNENNWDLPPFEAQIVDGMLCGRGAADMKGSIAAMTTAMERFLDKHPTPSFRLAWLITSDEEGPAINGTVKVVEWLESKRIKLDWCVVGEPSSTAQTGDVIKNGRRGSMGAKLKIKGVQGHVAYPHLAKNPIHIGMPALIELTETNWGEANQFFPATSFQISNLNSGTGATNVIPGDMLVDFNFRFSTDQTPEFLQSKVIGILNQHGLEYEIDWWVSGMPFLTASGSLVSAAVKAIKNVTNIDSELSTSGGTSDGRFIAPTGSQVVELGPVNATIHQVNERVLASDLDLLSEIYESLLEELEHSLANQ